VIKIGVKQSRFLGILVVQIFGVHVLVLSIAVNWFFFQLFVIDKSFPVSDRSKMRYSTLLAFDYCLIVLDYCLIEKGPWNTPKVLLYDLTPT
jgi:hypothetical protein